MRASRCYHDSIYWLEGTRVAQLLIRKLDDDVKANLRKRAKRHGNSMEEEARSILRAELLKPEGEEYGLGSKIAALFRDIPDNDEPFEFELKGPVRTTDFDE
jgi:plasmid stability protein